jgi:hypothetical protein
MATVLSISVRFDNLNGMGHGVKRQAIFYRLRVCPLDTLSITLFPIFGQALFSLTGILYINGIRLARRPISNRLFKAGMVKSIFFRDGFEGMGCSRSGGEVDFLDLP